MRVLCINNKPLPNTINGCLSLLKEGAIYTVVDAADKYCADGTKGAAYKLAEVPPLWYCVSRFVPLTGEETETLGELEVNQLVNA